MSSQLQFTLFVYANVNNLRIVKMSTRISNSRAGILDFVLEHILLKFNDFLFYVCTRCTKIKVLWIFFLLNEMHCLQLDSLSIPEISNFLKYTSELAENA